ncbi:MAG: lipocalin family protein [Aridibacter famidurans]|nr:lipocalin family protein [Aridibacter famidurans]
MKKILSSFLAGALLAAGLFAQDEGALKTVASVDLDRYKGKWFEIARYPNKFQKKCVGNTTATYTIESDGDIEVLNECLKKNGKMDRAKGEARIVDESTNAKLEVRFAPAFLSFLPFVWGDYWVIDLAEDYSYAVVGDPKREYLWILSRTPELETSVYQEILRSVEEKGFDPGKLVKTPQNVEVLKGQVIGE